MKPHCKTEDKFVHFPLIGRDETTNEGMMLTNSAILEQLGFLVPLDKGMYGLGKARTHQKELECFMVMHSRSRCIRRCTIRSYVESLNSETESI
jgi:hypothetical protein